MFATIVMGLLLIFGIGYLIFAIIDGPTDWDWLISSIPIVFPAVILATSLINGYMDHHGDARKEDIEQALRMMPDNPYIIEMAEEWNSDEKHGNNLWCRFTLKDEDLIDIYQILLECSIPESVYAQ